jgi:hypothetical protein
MEPSTSLSKNQAANCDATTRFLPRPQLLSSFYNISPDFNFTTQVAPIKVGIDKNV